MHDISRPSKIRSDDRYSYYILHSFIMCMMEIINGYSVKLGDSRRGVSERVGYHLPRPNKCDIRQFGIE